jgi:hypothetical protein
VFASLKAGAVPLDDVVRAATKYQTAMDAAVEAADIFVDTLAKV